MKDYLLQKANDDKMMQHLKKGQQRKIDDFHTKKGKISYFIKKKEAIFEANQKTRNIIRSKLEKRSAKPFFGKTKKIRTIP